MSLPILRADPLSGVLDIPGMTVQTTRDGLIPGGLYRSKASGHGITGTGSGETPVAARWRASMEWFERQAQFLTTDPPRIARGRRIDVPNGMDPRRFGLYSPIQYRWPAFPCVPFDEEQVYEWIEVREVMAGASACLPVEFVLPNASRSRRPLVRETSAGTAAGMSVAGALESAVCEAVERDALMRWWYRQEIGWVVAPDAGRRGTLCRDLEALAQAGYIVTLVRLEAAANLPCFLGCAERRGRVWLGSACGIDAIEATRHAVRELAETIAAFGDESLLQHGPSCLERVTRVADHHLVYQKEPFARAVKAVISTTFRPAARSSRPGNGTPGNQNRSFEQVCERLASEGFELFFCILGGPHIPGGPTVVRVVIRGLVPFHVGFGMERLGCNRLITRNDSGRIRTLLPHCFA